MTEFRSPIKNVRVGFSIRSYCSGSVRITALSTYIRASVHKNLILKQCYFFPLRMLLSLCIIIEEELTFCCYSDEKRTRNFIILLYCRSYSASALYSIPTYIYNIIMCRYWKMNGKYCRGKKKSLVFNYLGKKTVYSLTSIPTQYLKRNNAVAFESFRIFFSFEKHAVQIFYVYPSL